MWHSIKPILYGLPKDRAYLTAVGMAPVFWISLWSAGHGISGPGWVAENRLLFFQFALLYPLVEELVFRGLLQEWLWRTRLNRITLYCLSLPNIITSLVFTGFHFLAQPPGWALAVIFPSLVFGFFRDRYQHVLPAIFLHVFYNAAYFSLFGR